MKMKKILAGTLLTLTLGLALAGCNSGDSADAPEVSGQAQIQKQITAIQNNPNMPEHAKQQALQGLNQALAQAQTAESQGAASAAGQKKAGTK